MAKSKTAPKAGASSAKSTPVSNAASAKFDAAARALPEEAVRNTPTYPRAWLAWAAGVASAAARQSAALVKVPLEDGALTSEEILELAQLVEYVRAAKGRLDADRTTANDVDPSELALLLSIRADQQKIIRAFRTLRFRRNKVGLALISSLVRGSTRDPQDAVQDNTGLLSLCNSVDHEKWLATLPNGEGEAAARLWDRHNDLVTLAARWSSPTGAHEAREHVQRLWTTLRLRLERALIAGRYHNAGDREARDEYRGFRRPKARAKKK